MPASRPDVIAVTGWLCLVLPDWRTVMVRKCIAAALLLALSAWAEMLMAPMLLMYTAHALSAGAAAVGETVYQHEAMPAAHPCCPGLQKAATPAPRIKFATNSEPCGDEHRCCFRQAPRNMPAPAQEKSSNANVLDHVRIAVLAPDAGKKLAGTFAAEPAQSPPAESGMTLRV